MGNNKKEILLKISIYKNITIYIKDNNCDVFIFVSKKLFNFYNAKIILNMNI